LILGQPQVIKFRFRVPANISPSFDFRPFTGDSNVLKRRHVLKVQIEIKSGPLVWQVFPFATEKEITIIKNVSSSELMCSTNLMLQHKNQG
jgi:hypothetical protein